ncbi:MAG: hypothetical protein M1840_004425 [Geoglossum simile]|nr:MAG: hypothetical protein M1840_004425 [Geoglossum simile]
MRDNSAAIIFIALEFLFTHTISFCPHIETAVWGFLLDNPSIGYLRNILGVVGHVYSHAELIEVLTNPLPDHQIRRKQRALEKVGRKLHWNPTSNPRGSVFNLTGHRYLQLMKEASLNKWWSWQRARPQATRFPGMSAVDKFKTLWRVGQLLDWISWASETHGCAELLPLPKRLHDAISSTDADTNASIRGLRGLKRVVAEMRESLVPLQFANGRPRRGRPLLGCQDDCGGKISGLRKAAMCDSCLSDAPLGASPKTISEVRGNLAPRKQADPVEQQPIQTREDTGQLRAKAEAEIKECNKHKPSTYVTYGFKHRRIS